MVKPGFAFPLLLSILLSACSANRLNVPAPSPPQTLPSSPAAAQDTPSPPMTESPISTTGQPAPTNVRLEDPQEYFFSQLLPFDAIRPIYAPEFAHAEESFLFDEELVMGVAVGDEAKAYPVSVLRFREMVDDELSGLPILVTW